MRAFLFLGVDNDHCLVYNFSMVTGISVFVSLAYAVRETLHLHTTCVLKSALMRTKNRT